MHADVHRTLAGSMNVSCSMKSAKRFAYSLGGATLMAYGSCVMDLNVRSKICAHGAGAQACMHAGLACGACRCGMQLQLDACACAAQNPRAPPFACMHG